MTDKLYRSAQGKMVDLGALVLQNENVRAVGNMGVNARGDRIDASGNIVSSRGEQVNRSVNQTATNVKPAKSRVKSESTASVEPVAAATPAPLPVDESATTGLAAAINRVNKQ